MKLLATLLWVEHPRGLRMKIKRPITPDPQDADKLYLRQLALLTSGGHRNGQIRPR